MAVDVPMPKLGLTMEEATIIEWLVPDGASVESDQPIMLIETDKTETEVGAPGSGRLHQIGSPGQTFACGELVGQVLAEGESPPETAAPVTAAALTVATVAPVPRAGDVAPPPPPSGRLLTSLSFIIGRAMVRVSRINC